ncbi:hypothetical protein JHK82_039431 [Glycine max]|nr:hypothetical protein JHK86_039610 [Glycine max]KAG4965212.1 hypothetical protein JHK85_040187 [Glycine max]KAG5110208.1 hypothetical protein JHK82_039431 [Glycine max]KAG5121496.1 hypothetical protein JHK84_039836 [Glycine max]
MALWSLMRGQLPGQAGASAPTASGYCQFGLVVYATENESMSSSYEGYDDPKITEKQTW